MRDSFTNRIRLLTRFFKHHEPNYCKYANLRGIPDCFRVLIGILRAQDAWFLLISPKLTDIVIS